MTIMTVYDDDTTSNNYSIYITYKRTLNRNNIDYVDKDYDEHYDEINNRNIAMYYTKDDENGGDLSMYGIPDEFFKSRDLSKKHNLLVLLNEYVRVFGSIRNEHNDKYFKTSCADMMKKVL